VQVSQPSCFACLRRARRRRGALAGVALGLAGVGAVATALIVHRPKVDHGTHAPLMRQLRAEVARAPCRHEGVERRLEARIDELAEKCRARSLHPTL
jgi:hypothetical protein